VIATRPLLAQHDNDFPPTVGGSAARSEIGAADLTRPTLLLTTDHIDAVREVYQLLATPAVQQDRALQTAVRRFVFAGSRLLPQDRLIDLNICAEALFIKRGKLTGEEKGGPAAAMAEQLLAGDPILDVAPGEVEGFMRAAYHRRNAEIHGDHPTTTTMQLLNGATTDKLALLVEDLARVLGRAIQLVLIQATRPASN